MLLLVSIHLFCFPKVLVYGGQEFTGGKVTEADFRIVDIGSGETDKARQYIEFRGMWGSIL